MAEGETKKREEEITINISPKKLGVVFLVILILVAGVFLLSKNSGKKPDANVVEQKNENKPPVAVFKLTKDCYAYVPCQLDTTGSYDPDGRIVEYEWYENGTFFIGNNPIPKLFGMPKEKFSLTLKAYDDKGAVSVINKTIEIGERYRPATPYTATKDEQLSLIKKLCKEPIKITNYSNYYNDYINDLHVHLPTRTNTYNYTIALLATANDFGVKRMVISHVGAGVEGNSNYEREQDKLIAEIAQLCPERFDAMLTGVYPDDPSSVEYVKERLDTGLYKGIGEVYIRNFITGRYVKDISNYANSSTMMQIYKILAEKKKPIHFHLNVDSEEDLDALVQAMKENSNTIFIWAHGCDGYGQLTKVVDNLYCEYELVGKGTSYKTSSPVIIGIIGTDASVIPDEKYPDVQYYSTVMESSRYVLNTVSKEEADFMAHTNYERLIK